MTPLGGPVNAPVSSFERAAPGDGPAEARAIRNFEEANNRPSTPAQRRRLAELAAQFDAAAKRQSPGGSGWRWVAAAIDDGVDSGSDYMAPRRIETILTRWAAEGAPERASGGVVRLAEAAPPVRSPEPAPVASIEPQRESASAPVSAAAPVPIPGPAELAPEPFVIAECGMLSSQFWHVVLEDLVASGKLTRAERDLWLRPVRIAGRGQRGELILLAPNTATQARLERRKVNADLRAACSHIMSREIGLIIHAAPAGPEPAGLPSVDDLPARAD